MAPEWVMMAPEEAVSRLEEDRLKRGRVDLYEFKGLRGPAGRSGKVSRSTPKPA
jgi:hypothetical protein